MLDLSHHEKLLSDFRRYLEIDPDDLDLHISRLPTTFYTVCDHLTEASEALSLSKDDLEELVATLSDALRKKLERRDEKIVERRIQSEVELDKKYRKARTRYLKLRNIHERWAALKESFLQKSYMLRLMVQIRVQGNSQNSSVSVPGSEDTVHDAARKRLAGSRKKLRKKSKG